MRLTPFILAAAYEFLRHTPPFHRWKLPEADAVEFQVTREHGTAGAHTTYARTNNHIIQISERHVGHTDTLLQTMAHEMIHEKQREDGSETQGSHNAEFHRLAKIVCRHHGWDLRMFA